MTTTNTQGAEEQAAYDMGAKGAPATDAERLLFEAWMRGHCWALCATWDGKSYRSDAEQGGDVDPRAMNTRQLWAAWRDRAALASAAVPAQQPAPSAAPARVAPMSQPNRLIAYSAAETLRGIGYEWNEDTKAWEQPGAKTDSMAAAIRPEGEKQAFEAWMQNRPDPVGAELAQQLWSQSSERADWLDVNHSQPTPTAQADTKPTPVQDYPPLPECQGKIFDDGYWIQNKLGPKHYVMGGAKVWLESQVHEAIDADRAARAPAESVTAPGGVEEGDIDAIALTRYKVVHSHDSMFHRFAVVAGDGEQQLYLGRETECQNMTRKFAGAFLDGAFYQANIAPTPPAQAADSVLEDAARLDWLNQQCEGYGFQDIHEGNRWEISGPYANVRQAIDYERAARKQGEKQ